jgi:hypothetical protein
MSWKQTLTSSSSSESELLLSDNTFFEAAAGFEGSSSRLVSSLLSELDSYLADCIAFFGWAITWKNLFRGHKNKRKSHAEKRGNQ